MRHRANTVDSAALICRALRCTTLFADWPLANVEHLARTARLEHHKRRTQVLAADRRRREVLVVVSGCVEVSRTSAEGSKFVIILLRAGDCSGVVRLLPELRAPYDYVVLEDALLVHVPCDALARLMDAEPILWRSVALFALTRQRDNAASMQQGALSDFSGRLASILVELTASSDGSAGHGSRRHVRLSQSELGSMLGRSRQTINKELGKLSARGLVTVDYGKIEIVDLPALQALADKKTSDVRA
ncbi:Crp/Fnr family transcriptional regulator [Paraburkholderia sediminicola]|uniref:Crp/Fnr family transcriptional regulator n=1 Tax=Paraburkholderia sediminicola TaxID=458836 RepID=UPI0038BC9A93